MAEITDERTREKWSTNRKYLKMEAYHRRRRSVADGHKAHLKKTAAYKVLRISASVPGSPHPSNIA